MTHIEITRMLAILNTVKDHMTVQDVEEEFGYPADYIRRTCRKHGITLLSHMERNLLYIRQVAHVLTLEKIAHNLDMNEAYIKKVAEDAGIKLIEREKPLFLEGRRMNLARQTTY
jgi:hypothetical protein